MVLIGGSIMNVTVYRHQEYNKFLVTVDCGLSITEYTLYDMTVAEVAAFIREVTKEE